MTLNDFEYSCFSVFCCRKAEVIEALKSLELVWTNKSFTYIDIQPFFLNDCNWYPLSYNPVVLKVCLFETKDLRTVMISNLQDGAHSLFWNLATVLKVEAIAIRTSSKTTGDDIMNDLMYLNKGEEQRYVRTMTDPSWEFFEKGKPLWFEDVSLYSKRYKKDRMNRRIIVDYCLKLGLEVDSHDFWKAPEATMIEIKTCKQDVSHKGNGHLPPGIYEIL